MPRIHCRYIDCVFLESGLCAAEIVKIDPDEGCMTYTHIDDIPLTNGETWQDEDIDEIEDIEDIEDLDDVWEDDEVDDDEDAVWMDDEVF